MTPSVVWSLYAFLHSPDDYWTTICTAIGVGGDTDTMAAIAGAISGARLGLDALPAGLVERLNDRGGWGRDALIELARRARCRTAGRGLMDSYSWLIDAMGPNHEERPCAHGKIYQDVAETVGNTPLIRLNRLGVAFRAESRSSTRATTRTTR